MHSETLHTYIHALCSYQRQKFIIIAAKANDSYSSNFQIWKFFNFPAEYPLYLYHYITILSSDFMIDGTIECFRDAS